MKRTPRKICFVTGTRAEYGLLKWVMRGMRKQPSARTQLIVTGTHLAHGFGETINEIKKDGFEVDWEVEMQLGSDTASATAKSVGLGVIGFADAFKRLQPDAVVLLGDRFEILSAAVAALFANIPVAHIHGGEVTEGALDEAIRHSVSKMAHIHFTATEEYRRRVIQLGELPEKVFAVGGLGVDAITHVPRLSRREVEKRLGVPLMEKNLLVTFHPETAAGNSALDQIGVVLKALSRLRDTLLVFTMPNADTGGREVAKAIESFVVSSQNALMVPSLGQELYFNCIRYFDGVLGNSSSGLLEVPSFKKGTINIGDRQKGRMQASSVISCPIEVGAIVAAVGRLYSPAFVRSLKKVVNPYGNGRASCAIVNILLNHDFSGITRKSFYDIPFHAS